MGLDDDRVLIDCQTAGGLAYPRRVFRACQHDDPRHDLLEAANATGREEGRAWRNLGCEPGDRPLGGVPGSAEGDAQC
jgi:hypothetical protein